MTTTTKPQRVDRYEYWRDPPPEPSPRLAYWLDRIAKGWKPNRHIRTLGYDEMAEFYGVYMWESLHILFPATTGHTVNLPPSKVREWLDEHGLDSSSITNLMAIPAKVGWDIVEEGFK